MAPQTITVSAAVNAPIARVFALSTRVELVRKTLGMHPVAQPGTLTAGHVVLGSRVLWRGWKFLLPTSHLTLITGYAGPHPEEDGVRTAWFQDSQERGRFAWFQHDHSFRETLDPATRLPLTHLEDKVRFALPLGALGHAAAAWWMAPYIQKLARRRFAMIKELAEGEGWREWVS